MKRWLVVGMLVGVVTGCESASLPLGPEAPLFSSLEGLTEDEIYDLYQSGQLEAVFPSYIGILYLTPTVSDISADAVMLYEYTSTTQWGDIELKYREGDNVLTSVRPPAKTTGGPRLYLASGHFSHDASIPIQGSPCGKNALAYGWAEVWNELALIKYVIPPFGRKPKDGSNVKEAPSIYCEPPPPPPPGGGGSDDEQCYYCEYWVYEDQFGNIVDDEWICWEIDDSICDQYLQ